MSAASHESSDYRALLGDNPDFRRLWLGKLVSLLGDWFNTLALYHAISQVSTSARAIALVMVLKTLPMFLVTPWSGALLERVDRRTLLLAADAFRCLCALGMLFAHALGSLALLYAAAALMMCATGVAVPATNTIIPSVVPRRHVAGANALMSGSWSTMMALGAVIGGLSTQLLGVAPSFALDAATYVLSALLFWRLPPQPPSASTGERRSRSGLIAALRYLARDRYLSSLFLLKPLRSLSAGLQALIPLYGTIVFSEASGAAWVGMLYASRGAGALIGSVALGAWVGASLTRMRRTLLLAFALVGMSLGCLSVSAAFWQAALAIFVSSVGQAALWVCSSSLMQLEVDPRFHGRLFASEFSLAMLLMATSGFAAGALVDRGLALGTVVQLFASFSLIPIVVWGLACSLGHRRAAG